MCAGRHPRKKEIGTSVLDSFGHLCPDMPKTGTKSLEVPRDYLLNLVALMKVYGVHTKLESFSSVVLYC